MQSIFYFKNNVFPFFSVWLHTSSKSQPIGPIRRRFGRRHRLARLPSRSRGRKIRFPKPSDRNVALAQEVRSQVWVEPGLTNDVNFNRWWFWVSSFAKIDNDVNWWWLWNSTFAKIDVDVNRRWLSESSFAKISKETRGPSSPAPSSGGDGCQGWQSIPKFSSKIFSCSQRNWMKIRGEFWEIGPYLVKI